jgi:AraC-like DNA-binding protein
MPVMTATSELTPQYFEDWAAVHDAVADAYFPHVMKPLYAGPASRSALQTVDLGSCRITQMKLGATVSVQSDCPGAYGINIPVGGEMESMIGRIEVVSGVGQATACPPDTPVRIPRWKPSCHLIGFKVEESHLRREMERTLARPAKALPLQLDLRSADGQTWLRLLQSIVEQVYHSDARLLRDDRFTAQLAGAVTTGFVLATMPDDTVGRIGTRPRIVRRVMTAIEEDPARSWSPADMAEIAGVSVRRLQQGFCEYVGQTPFQYLRDVRLERAHADLVSSEQPATVTDIALRWGFMHMSRFAADYRRKYGRPPSQTLAR